MAYVDLDCDSLWPRGCIESFISILLRPGTSVEVIIVFPGSDVVVFRVARWFSHKGRYKYSYERGSSYCRQGLTIL